MPNHSKKPKPRLIFISGIFIGILILILSTFRGNVILDDPFHQGEFFAATVAFFSDSTLAFHPLTIHGALDYIPGLFTEYMWGNENYFLPTIAIYKFLNFLAAIFLILIAYHLTQYKNNKNILLLAVTLIAPLLVGYRDLILLLSIYTFFKVYDSNIDSDIKFFLQTFFGAIVAFGVFWSYDRGIAGVLSLGAAIFFLLFKNHRYAISLIAFVVTAVGLSLIFKPFSIENYINDVNILMETSKEWSYGWKKWPVILTLFTVIFNVTTISLFVCEILKSESLNENLPIIIGLGFLSIFMLKIGVNRADLQHIYFSLWIPILILLFIHEKISHFKMYVGVFIITILFAGIGLAILQRTYGLALIAGILAFNVLKFKTVFFNKFSIVCFYLLITGCLGLVLYSSAKGALGGQFTWISSLASPVSNRLTSTDGVVWISDRLRQHNVKCIFDLSNNGVINGLVRRPSCSKFTYPVYAGPTHESILITDLRNASPSALVYSSTYWSYKIDHRDMKKRFPELDKFILDNYPNEECGHGYCLRYKAI